MCDGIWLGQGAGCIDWYKKLGQIVGALWARTGLACVASIRFITRYLFLVSICLNCLWKNIVEKVIAKRKGIKYISIFHFVRDKIKLSSNYLEIEIHRFKLDDSSIQNFLIFDC